MSRLKQEALYDNDGVRAWPLKDDVLVVSFKSKANTLGQAVLDGLEQVLDIAEQQYQGLIVYQQDAANFSLGADLREVGTCLQQQTWDRLGKMLGQFQHLAMRLKYATIPTIAALRGRALGGGCELMLHCARTIAAFESYPGLVEVGVGLLPAGGGCKEMAIRAANSGDFASLQFYFENMAMAIVAGSAPDALRLGYLQAKDTWVMHQDDVLFAASANIQAMQAAHYMPPIAQRFPVAGREGHARLQARLVNALEGGFISQQDYLITNHLARVLCGGEVDEGTLVDEQWMLRLEKEAFLELAETPLTQARIKHMLETGSPLHN
jgi:3-hydroxyacyl-CoA dehydrogenase